MSGLTLNQDTRMTDALERELLRDAMESQPDIHPLTALKRGALAIVDYIGEVSAAMNRARAQSARYSGSQW